MRGTIRGLARCLRSAGHGALTEPPMPITHFDIVTIQPLVALLFGILILIVPRLLNYLIAIYLIMIGVMGLWPQLFTHPIH
jgi:hypothetical protein